MQFIFEKARQRAARGRTNEFAKIGFGGQGVGSRVRWTSCIALSTALGHDQSLCLLHLGSLLCGIDRLIAGRVAELVWLRRLCYLLRGLGRLITGGIAELV